MPKIGKIKNIKYLKGGKKLRIFTTLWFPFNSQKDYAPIQLVALNSFHPNCTFSHIEQ